MLWLYYFLDISGNLEILLFILGISFLALLLVGGVFLLASTDHNRESIEFKEYRFLGFHLIKISVIVFIISMAIMITKPSKDTIKFLTKEIEKELSINKGE